MSTLSQYADIAYLVELVALGLIAAALLAVTISIIMRRSTGKHEHETMLKLRRSAEQDKKIFDATVSEINNIGKKVKDETSEVQEQIASALEKAADAEQRADNITVLELEMKQLVDGTTERMAHIQEYWDQQLKYTVKVISEINEKLDKGLSQSGESNEQADVLVNTLTERMKSNITSAFTENKINLEIRDILHQALNESKQLLHQIKTYQSEAEAVFSSFRATLGDVESHAHEQFDEVFNAADMARQELNANLDESRQYIKLLRKTPSQDQKSTLQGFDEGAETPEISKETSTLSGRHGRPIISVNDAKNLTDPTLFKSYGKYPNREPETKDIEGKDLENPFSKKFRRHGS